MRRFVIIAGGELPEDEVIEIHDDDRVICADRGYGYALKRGIMPHILIGDFDSYDLPEDAVPEDVEVLRSVPEKDDTDTLMAVRTAIERGAENIVIYGALGGRLDHTIANIQTLIYIHSQGCTGEIRSAVNTAMILGTGEHHLENIPGWYLSIFAATAETVIEELSGVKYPLSGYTMTPCFPIGVSNEITGSQAILKISGGLALVIRSAE